MEEADADVEIKQCPVRNKCKLPSRLLGELIRLARSIGWWCSNIIAASYSFLEHHPTVVTLVKSWYHGYASTPLRPADVFSPQWVWICLPPRWLLEWEHILIVLIGSQNPKGWARAGLHEVVINFDTLIGFDWLDTIKSLSNLFCTAPLTLNTQKRLLGWQFHTECI